MNILFADIQTIELLFPSAQDATDFARQWIEDEEGFTFKIKPFQDGFVVDFFEPDGYWVNPQNAQTTYLKA